MPNAEFKIPARLTSLNDGRERIAKFLSAAGVSSGDIDVVVMAVDEAIVNIIEHAYNGAEGEITVGLRYSAPEFIVSLTDGAKYANPLAGAPEENGARKDLLTEKIAANVQAGRDGGLGVAIYLRIMDTVEHTHHPGRGNVLTMKKIVAPAG